MTTRTEIDREERGEDRVASVQIVQAVPNAQAVEEPN
jgi:hypothetical protein